MASQLPLGYIHMFILTDSQIIEIGRLVIKEKSAEYAGTVHWIDIYPNARGNGFSRGVSGGSGDYWYPSGAVEIKDSVGGLEEVLGYYRDLVLYRGGKGCKGGKKTNWMMREYFVSSKIENDKVLAAANSLKAKARKIIFTDAIVARGVSREPLSAKDKGKGLMVEEEPPCWGDMGDMWINKGKGDVHVTRSQSRLKVLNVKGKEQEASIHKRLVKARGKERVPPIDDEREYDFEWDRDDESFDNKYEFSKKPLRSPREQFLLSSNAMLVKSVKYDGKHGLPSFLGSLIAEPLINEADVQKLDSLGKDAIFKGSVIIYSNLLPKRYQSLCPDPLLKK
ncbi:no apical meristem protein [Tanacetum coccineum]